MLMWFDRFPEGTPPTFLAALRLARCVNALASGRPPRMAWSRGDETTLAGALSQAIDELQVRRPDWERHSVEPRYVGVRGYDCADYCSRVERVCGAILDGWKVAGERSAWLERARADGGDAYFDASGGYIVPGWVSVPEVMTARYVLALREVARYEAAGRVNLAWQAVAASALNAGIALGASRGTVADIDKIARTAISAAGKRAALARHSRAEGKPSAFRLWDRWQCGKEAFHTNEAFAKEAERLGYGKHSTALKWASRWARERKASRSG